MSEQALDTVELPDGRRVDIATCGDPGGRVVVYHHGTPTCRSIPSEFRSVAGRAGLRFLGFSRPGYGASTPSPGRSVADDAALVSDLLDQLGVGEFVSIGWSGGGPHALAAAALLPGRCRAAAVIAGVAPYDAHGLDFLAGMGQDNVDEFGAARTGPEALRSYLETAAEGLRSIEGHQIVEGLASLLPQCDRDVLTDDSADELAAGFREAVSRGIEGWFDDDIAFISPWGFDLGAITTPVSVWQGALDLMVPLAHGRWLVDNVAGAVGHEVPGQGHLSVVHGLVDAMLDELVEAGWGTGRPAGR